MFFDKFNKKIVLFTVFGLIFVFGYVGFLHYQISNLEKELVKTAKALKTNLQATKFLLKEQGKHFEVLKTHDKNIQQNQEAITGVGVILSLTGKL